MNHRPDPLQAFGLALILALAAVLRFWGLEWGVPDATHPDYSYHPDEAATIGWSSLLPQGLYIAKHFQYGGTLHYSILNAYRHLGEGLAPVLHGVNPAANAVLAGRGVVAIVSLMTVLLLYQTGRLLFDRRVALLAALMLAIAPVHVVLAKNVRPDEVSTFIAMVLLYISAAILRGNPADDRRLFAWAGFVLGISIALRFPLAAFAVGPLVARLLRDVPAGGGRAPLNGFGRNLLEMMLMGLIGYAISSPHSLLHPDELMKGLTVTWLYESGAFPDAVDRGPGIYQYGWLMMREAFGLALCVLVGWGVVAACMQRARPQLLLLVFMVPYFLLTSFASWVVVRYLLPLVPPLLLLTASALQGAMPQRRLGRNVAGAAVAAILIWTTAADVAFARMQAGVNVRDVASEWLRDELPAGCAVLTLWLYEGDVYLNPVVPAQCQHYVLNTRAGSDPRALLARGFDRVIVNESLYLNAERLGASYPMPEIYAVWQALDQTGYRLQTQFKSPVSLLGIDFSGDFRSQDYAIVDPGIRVYRRN